MQKQLKFNNMFDLTLEHGYLIKTPKEMGNIKRRRERMVNIEETAGSQYLKADYIKDNKITKLVIKTEPTYVEGKFGKSLVCTVDIEDQEMKWNINPTTQGMIASKHGNDSADWVGKQINLRLREIRGKATITGMPA